MLLQRRHHTSIYFLIAGRFPAQLSVKFFVRQVDFVAAVLKGICNFSFNIRFTYHIVLNEKAGDARRVTIFCRKCFQLYDIANYANYKQITQIM